MRLLALLTFVVCALGQPPSFHPRDIRPHGAAEPHPLLPGMLVWIFGENLGPPCGVENSMDPRTYKTTLCGVRVLFGGIEAKLLFTGPKQINLIAPDHPWENETVNVQVVNEDGASAVVPAPFGVNRPVLSLAAPAFAGMPVWVHVEEPWGKGWLRYPHWTEPWEIASGRFDVRFAGSDLATLPLLPYQPTASLQMGNVGLPHEPPAAYRNRAPLHLVYAFDRPGTYEVRYTEMRWNPGGAPTVYQQSEWTPIEVRASTVEQRRAWLLELLASRPTDTVELLSNYLPSLLAVRDEAVLRIFARYLDSPDQLLRQYAQYALNYFDAKLLERVVPGQQPLRMFVR
jgi:hypothetical protein